jgi:hypothetical protein
MHTRPYFVGERVMKAAFDGRARPLKRIQVQRPRSPREGHSVRQKGKGLRPIGMRAEIVALGRT